MKTFARDDGHQLAIVHGFKEQARSYRVSASPREDWDEARYETAAKIRLRRWRQRLEELSPFVESFEGLRVLEVGCGAGIDCLLCGLEPVKVVVGIDRELPLFASGSEGDRIRRLVRALFASVNSAAPIPEILEKHPGSFARADAARLPFPDGSFDLAWSRSVLEHVTNLDSALAEMRRVVRPGGLIYHLIDPFYWLRGCHKRGVVDVPWAHARLSLDEYRRFVAETEGDSRARKRVERLRTLNRITLAGWREIFEAQPLEILSWEETQNQFAVEKLRELPEVRATLLDGVEARDLTCDVLKVCLRNRCA